MNPKTQQLYLQQQMLPKNQMVSLNLKKKTYHGKKVIINTKLHVTTQKNVVNCGTDP